MATLSDPDVRAFLSAGTRTGHLSWVASDGRPVGAPVWFVLEDETVAFTTWADSAKGRALQRDPRVTLVVDLQEPPYGFVQVQGTVEIVDDCAALRRVATAAGARYMGAERGQEFGERNGVEGELLLRLHPVKVIANLDVTG